MGRIAGRFARVEPRRRAGWLVLGLLADLPRKNCWAIAEWTGDPTPHGLQHLLSRASWDADTVRDDVRDYVVEHLRDDAAVLVVDETGDVKKGTHTVGVQRQYTGTAGRIENSQVAVYLAYAGSRGHAAVDRELYVPRAWTTDPDRCQAAGIPEERAFATKPELAAVMIERFLDAGHHAAWAAGDEVYGGNPKLRAALETRGRAALAALGPSLANELGHRGITVNTIEPGVVLTDMIGDYATVPEAVAALESITALGRIGEPDDTADVMGFLAGPQGRWVTGQTIDVSGGTYLGPLAPK
ncbi:IS701 family transposase [Streptomyces cyaneofuscatus]